MDRLTCVLFDLDGTLVDSLRDLAGAVNAMRKRRGLPAIPECEFSEAASVGSRLLLEIGLGVSPDSPSFPALREEFFAEYRSLCLTPPRLFPGVAGLLRTLSDKRTPWGIVTNKPQEFASRIVGLEPAFSGCGIVIGAREGLAPKPSPEGILLALGTLAADAPGSVYVGDDARDIAAGQAAGVKTILARWGYGTPVPAPLKPDAAADRADEILPLLRQFSLVSKSA